MKKVKKQFEIVTRNRRGRKRFEIWATYEEFMQVQLMLDGLRGEKI